MGYSKGVNQAALEIERYKTQISNLSSELVKSQSEKTVKVVTEYKDKIQYIDRVVYKNRDIVRTVVPEQFNLSRGWIYAYNQSVQGLDIDPELAKNPTPSTISEMKALADTIMPNNGICLATREQLLSLQRFITEMEKSREEVVNRK